MAAIQDVPRLVLQAILASQSPQALPQQRKEAVAFLEQLKRADVTSVFSACATLTSIQQLAQQYGALLQPTDVVGVRLAAYQLIIDAVRHRWRELSPEHRVAVTQLALQQFREAVSPAQDPAASALNAAAAGSFPERGKAAEFLAVVVRQQGAGAYTELMPQLMAGASGGPTQAELTCRVLLYISEDLTQFEVSGLGGAVGASGDGATADTISPGNSGSADGPDVTSKRAFLSALTASATTVFPFLCEVLEHHFQAAQQLQSTPLPPVPGAAGGGGGTGAAAGVAGPAGSVASPEQQRRDQISAHVAALSAALGALGTWVEWVPMRRLGSSSVLSACAFFIREGTSALRMQALDVLRQITWRKRGNESFADYSELMDGVAGALLGSTAALGLLLGPQDPLPPAMVRELGYGGSQADLGSRVLEVVEGLGEGHYRALSETSGRRAAFLTQLLTFTRHPYLRLSGGTLTLWQQLLREATPQHALAPGSGAAVPSETSAGGGGSGQGSPGSSGGGGSGGSRGTTQGQLYTLPVGVVSELMRVLCGGMARVVPSADPGVNNVPDWCDSHAEYKEVVVSYRSQAKAIMRLASSLAPEQALQAAAALLSSALTACAAPAPGAAAVVAVASPLSTSQLEAAVLVLTAVLPPLCDMAAAALGLPVGGGGSGASSAVTAVATPAAQAAAAAVVGGVADLLQAVLRVRLSDPRHMTLHAEAIEAFGRYLTLRPDLAVPTVSCCLEVMRLLPLEAPGQLPPPPRQTPEWRAQFEARLAMANVLLGLARAAPGALVPHLSALVAEISGLWERGLLREGERVLLWEGLLAASSAASPHTQSQLVELIFRPIAEQWSSAEWQAAVASPQAFVEAYMPLVPSAAAAAGGSGCSPMNLGARERRWTLYHQVTLLERALRRTAPAMPSGAAASGGSGGGAASSSPAEHPFNPHLEWCLPPVARLVACIHALSDPRVRPSLGPLTLVNEMDALERAMRLGEDRDAVKASEQPEPRCVAGANLQDARYFVRGVRECCYMVLSLATQNCGTAMWRSETLAALLPAAVAGGASTLGDAVVRLLVRHVLSPWAQRCPPGRVGAWIVPLCGVFLPHMHERLSNSWATLQAGGGADTALEAGGSGRSSGQPAGGPAAAGVGGVTSTSGGVGSGASDATSDEVLRDVLLRELTREHLGFLNALATRRPLEDSGAGGGLPAGSASTAQVTSAAGGGGGGGGGVGPGSGGALAVSATALVTLSPRVSTNGSGAVQQECILEVLLRCQPAAAQAGLVTGVAAICWPDTDSAQKAVNFSRSLLALAQSGHSELEGFVIGAVTRSAISSLGMVSTVMVQAQVLELLRSVLVSYLPPNQPHASLLRAVLGELPGLTPQVLDNFTVSFCATQGDKEQRGLIKKLLTAVGGDEIRTLLAAVSKLPGGVSAVPEPKHRERGPILDITPQDMGLPHLFDLPDVL
ncbi:hypothetical protein VaNZ11_007546 [Volvox africanus]|uniref:Exportin-5 C-terminal domain-containing protein n=1 Tax=Volvox africanus TaxID=51714 RepID=A0ABQ5S3H8_9CHLO|nr:hypothetical protein VaNZ11_007546 [Volvox africanus]